MRSVAWENDRVIFVGWGPIDAQNNQNLRAILRCSCVIYFELRHSCGAGAKDTRAQSAQLGASLCPRVTVTASKA
jgi:hypothetical protein